MAYFPGNVPSDPKALPGFLSQELPRLVEALNAPAYFLPLVELHAAPAKPRDGLYLVDGTDFDPGSGAGVYAYYGGAYHFLG